VNLLGLVVFRALFQGERVHNRSKLYDKHTSKEALVTHCSS